MKFSKNKVKDIFIVITILILSCLLPSIKIGIIIDDIKIGQILVLGLILLESIRIMKKKYILKEIFPLILILILNIIFVFFSQEIVKIAEANMPIKWYSMYHTKINNFYKPIKQSIFQIINIITFLIIYNIGVKKSDIKINIVIKISKIGIIIQLLISVFQKYYLNIVRTYGTLENAQAIGSYVLILLGIIIFSKKKQSNFKYIMFSFIIIYLSGTNSSLVMFLIEIIIYYTGNIFIKKKYFYIILLTNIFLVTILICNENISSWILTEVNKITSAYTLRMRFMMWNGFYKTLSNNFLLGTMGRIPRFSENTIWYILLPYGFVGLISYIYWINFLIRKNNKIIYIVLLIMIIQGISYYGFFIAPVAYIYFFILGYFSRQNRGEKIK